MIKRHALVKRLAWTVIFVNLVDLTVKNLSEGVMSAILGFITCLMGGSTLIIGRRFSARNFMKEAREISQRNYGKEACTS
jgi:hypothetical protein